jgi:hypothetical protein
MVPPGSIEFSRSPTSPPRAFRRARDGSSKSARRELERLLVEHFAGSVGPGGACESCRSRRANLLRYQAMPAALGA